MKHGDARNCNAVFMRRRYAKAPKGERFPRDLASRDSNIVLNAGAF